jgi:hypothetical protein
MPKRRRDLWPVTPATRHTKCRTDVKGWISRLSVDYVTRLDAETLAHNLSAAERGVPRFAFF